LVGTNITGTAANFNINGTVGATTPSTVTGTTITASTSFVGTNFDAAGSGGGALRNNTGANCLQWGAGGGVNLTLDGAFNMNPANATISIAPTGTGTLTINPATAGTINNMAIGGTTPRAGAFTTLTASTAIGIASGGTGQTSANAAFNALAPSQTGNSGKYLTTDGTDTSWASNPLGTVTSVAASVPSFLSIAGSPITTSGTLAISLSGTALPTTSGGTGLTSFTANGVAYASSSSALATGSALTFDGTNLSLIGVSTSPIIANIQNTNTNTSAGGRYQFSYGGIAVGWIANQFDGADFDNKYVASKHHIFYTGNTSPTEALRLTSSSLYTASGINVAIGANSAGSKLDVVRSATTTTAFDEPVMRAINNGTATLNQRVDIALRFQDGTYNGIGGISMLRESATARSGALVFSPIASDGNALAAMRLDSAGNLGLRVTPSAWSGFTALQVTSGFAAWSSGVANARINANTYYNAGYRYIGTGTATMYEQDGYHAWYTAASGLAGDLITWTQTMTLNASGQLLLGATTGSGFKTRIQDDSLQVRLQASTNTNQGLTLGYTYSGGYGQINCDEAGVNQKDLWYTALTHQFGRNTSSSYVTIDASGNMGVSAGMLFVSRPTGNTQFTSGIGINASNTTGEGIEFLTTASTGTRLLAYDRNVAAFRRLDLAGNEIHLSPNNSTSVIVNGFGLGVGASTPSSGTGITFPATQSASSNANTLDDYEEGSWTPELVGSGTTGTPVAGLGYYTKVGNLVTIFYAFEGVASPSGATDILFIRNMPFQLNLASSAYNYGNPGLIYTNGGTSLPNMWFGHRINDATGLQFYFTYYANVNTAPSNFLVSNLGGSGNYLRGYFSYQF
jgi:hypothetical protein